MPKQFFISLFDRSYQPGESVAGEVTLFVKKEKRYQSIEIVLNAHGDVKFTSNYASRHVHSRHVLSHQTLWKFECDGDKLSPGNHTWPFSMVLRTAPSLSPSFEGKYGYIRYNIESRIIKSKEHLLKKKPTCVEKIFEIKIPVHIALKYLQPLAVHKETAINVCRFCTSSSGSISMNIELFRAGYYAPDDAIVMQIGVENESQKYIPTICVGLVQFVEYRAGEYVKGEGELISSASSEPIHSNSSVLWQPLPFYIHSLQTTLTDHPLISVTYVLQVSAVISGTSSMLMEIPIFMGNVPLSTTKTSASASFQIPPEPLPIKPHPDRQQTSISGDAVHDSSISSHPYAYANFQSQRLLPSDL